MGAVLRVDWCSYEAAKYACEKWHYSKSIPASKTVKIGAWEDDRFIGCCIFSWGSNQHLGKQFGLKMTECCELTRVALARHQTPVTRILSIAIRFLRRQSPGLRLIISYADCDEGHHGGIYAGGNWVYIGKVQNNGGTPKYRIHGQVMHGRSVHSKWGSGSQSLEWLRKHVDPHAEHVYTLGKHKYAMPLDDEMRARVNALKKPYPKRAGSADGGTAGLQPAGGGSNPTPALDESEATALTSTEPPPNSPHHGEPRISQRRERH